MLKYKIGSATDLKTIEPAIIVHCCNDLGKWGAGFVLSISEKWPHVEKEYKNWYAGKEAFGCTDKFNLGEVQFVVAEFGVWVANIIGQKGIYLGDNGQPPIRYEAIRSGLQKVREFAISSEANIHMPRMGSGLAGGKWSRIEEIIVEELGGLDVTVYDLP